MNKILLVACVLLFAFSANLDASSITGTVTTPNTSVPIANGTFTFTLNQAGILAGTFSIASTPVTCGTSSTGAVVGITNPLVAPSSNAVAAAGSLSGTYYVKITYYGTSVETMASPVTVVSVSGGNNAITTSAPTLQPATATGYKIYVGTTLGSEKLQTTVSSWSSSTLTSFNAGGAALPASNNTVCSLSFNVAIIPSFTFYRVNLVDAQASQISGFPQNWYLSGSSIDISNQYPLAQTSQQTRFPSPLLSNPSSNAQQSVNSPVTFNGYAVTAGSLVLPDNASPSACAAAKSVLYTDASTHKLMACQNGGSATAVLDAITNGWTDGGVNIYNTTQTDRVMIGLGGSSGDFASSTYNGSLIVNQQIYISSGAVTDASVLGCSWFSASSIFYCGTNITGAGTQRPFGIVTSGTERTRWDISGRILHGLTGTNAAVEANALMSLGGIYVQSVTGSNASTVGMNWDSGSSTVRFSTGALGSGTVRPLAFTVNGTEAFRLTVTNRNLVIGATTDTSVNTPLQIVRSQDGSTDVQVSNATNPGATASARASVLTSSAAGDFYHYATPSGYTANGALSSAIYGAAGVLATTAGLTNGLTITTGAGPIRFYPGSTSTVEATLTVGTGLTLAHALPVTSGGTGSTSAWSTNGVLYGSSTTTTATESAFVYDAGSNLLAVTGGILASSTARVNPAGGTAYVHLFYDSSGDEGAIGTVNYTGPTYKPFLIFGSAIRFDINGADAFLINANGPRWALSTNASAGGTTLSLASTTFPGSVGGIPYTWLKATAQDGTLVWIPAFK